MKKIYLVIIFLSSIVSGLIAQTHNFRNSNWGDGVAAVKASETIKLISETATKLVYEHKLADSPTQVIYQFTLADKLMRTKYLVAPEYYNAIFYVRDYRIFLSEMTEKYGKPSKVSQKVLNKLNVNEEEWAAYLSFGEIVIETKWALAQSEIFLTLSKVGNFPIIQIDYISKNLIISDIEERKKALETELE